GGAVDPPLERRPRTNTPSGAGPGDRRCDPRPDPPGGRVARRVNLAAHHRRPDDRRPARALPAHAASYHLLVLTVPLPADRTDVNPPFRFEHEQGLPGSCPSWPARG